MPWGRNNTRPFSHPILLTLETTAPRIGYSSACVQSILSGAYPEEHLHWSYFTRNDQRINIPRWMHYLPACYVTVGGSCAGCRSPSLNGIILKAIFKSYQVPFRGVA